MCRALLYLGEPVLLDHLLFQPDSSLVKQSYMPRMLQMLNLAGFGMMVWDHTSHDAEMPFRYGSTALPVFDPVTEDPGELLSGACPRCRPAQRCQHHRPERPSVLVSGRETCDGA
jgi:hypothetical protein